MAETKMHVSLRQIEGMAFAIRADSGHWVTVDGPAEFSGFEAASRPMELLLMAYAGCTGMDVVSILRKKRTSMHDFQIEAYAKRTDQYPKVFTEIELVYRVFGDVKEADVARAIKLSQEKYCPVAAMLRPTVTLSNRFEIVRDDDQ